MTSSALSILIATLVALSPRPGMANPCEPPCTIIPAPPPTHFIAELNGGSTTFGGGGPIFSALLGAGGKLRGFPPIFYLIGEATYAASQESGGIPTTGVGYRDERNAWDLLWGPRIYLPIFGPVRLFGEVLIGASHVTAHFSRDGQPTVAADDWLLLTRLGVGLQVRLFHYLSVGGRFQASVAQRGLDAYRSALDSAGVSPSMRTTATATVTWHF
ncbi:MAG: hypothetical protein JRH20_13065 [Deltaproteobacteria bacterium]|nr:hypothetical protein [Deltaproteobacteria bacterium]